ncbi:hypothetical protein FRC12_007791 [Ceratobasidium sp. 428]|nr:hypothetical protein FRC12_007791 [Ceratobasidium sp. 428]
MAEASLNQVENNQIPSFSFQPPPGGDVSLKSSDGTVFVVHSMFLSFSSKVFSDMLTTSTKSDVIELAEDAEAISLMLAFIYPMVHPAIDNVSLLEKAMLMAHKYEVDTLAKTVVQASSQCDLIRQNPLRIYQVAGNYGFKQLELLSAKLITRSHYDMTTVEGLVKFAKEYPESSRIIGLVGVHGVRSQVLNTCSPKNSWTLCPSQVWVSSSYTGRYEGPLACGPCFEKWQGSNSYKTGWLDCWFARFHSALADKLLDECDSYFTLSYLATLRGEVGCCGNCLDITRLKIKDFETWAKKTRSYLQEELAKLDVLYALDLS